MWGRSRLKADIGHDFGKGTNLGFVERPQKCRDHNGSRPDVQAEDARERKLREWRPAEMNPGDFHTFDVSVQFLFVGCSDERILRLELETGEERYSNDLGGGGVQEIVISRSGETFAAVCDDCKVRCRGRLRHATWQDLPAGGRQRQESRSSSESMNFWEP